MKRATRSVHRPRGDVDPRAEAATVLARFKAALLPVPVEAIARGLGARLSLEPFEGEGEISGFVARRQKLPPIIGVNSAHPGTRQRFTIAHEIGHLVMHEGQPLIVDKLVKVNLRHAAMPSSHVETEANRFAAALLMPEPLVLREFARLVPRGKPVPVDQIVETLAHSFNVSSQAMRIRLNELELLSPMSLY